MGSEFLPKQFSREAKKPSKLFASDEPFIIPPSSETVDKKELPAEIPPADYALPGFGTKPKQLAIQSKNSEAQSESVLDNGEKQLQTSQNKSGDKKKEGGDWLPKSVQWVWGVLQGDFNKNPSTSQVVVRTLITLIPGIDQVADVQDLIASLYILAWERKYDDFGAWFNLFLTGIGLIPTVGSAFKGVVKTLKTSDNVNLAAITKLLGPFANKLDSLRNFSTYTNQAAGHAKRVIGDLTNKVAETANTLREYIRFDPTGKLRPFINKLDEFNNSLKSIRASIDDKFRQIGEEIQQQLDKLLGGNGQLATANGAPLPKRGSEIDQAPRRIEGGSGGKKPSENLTINSDDWKDLGLRDRVEFIINRNDLEPSLLQKIKKTLKELNQARVDGKLNVEQNKKAFTDLVSGLGDAEIKTVEQRFAELEHAAYVLKRKNLDPNTPVVIGAKHNQQLDNLPKIDIENVEADTFYKTIDGAINLTEVKNTPNAFVEKLDKKRQFERYQKWIKKGSSISPSQKRVVQLYIRKTGPGFEQILDKDRFNILSETIVRDEAQPFMKIGEYIFSLADLRNMRQDAMKKLGQLIKENPGVNPGDLAKQYFGTVEKTFETLENTYGSQI